MGLLFYLVNAGIAFLQTIALTYIPETWWAGLFYKLLILALPFLIELIYFQINKGKFYLSITFSTFIYSIIVMIHFLTRLPSITFSQLSQCIVTGFIIYFIADILSPASYVSSGGKEKPQADHSSSNRDGYSVEKEGFFKGPYTEHYDYKGNKIGESQAKEGFFKGSYTEHYDANGNKVGESQAKEGFFKGQYTEHYDANGNKVGESQAKEGFFKGPYTEHYDVNGNKIGESQAKEGFFRGPYIEHTGTDRNTTGTLEKK